MSRLIHHLKPWFFVSTLSRVASSAKTQIITRTATGGTATFTVAGETTADTAVVAATTAAQVKTALLTLDGIDTGDIDVTGSTGGPFTVTGSIGDITIDDSSATGGDVTVAAGTSYEPGTVFQVPIGDLDDAADITEAIRSSSGWSYEVQDVDVPDLSSTFPKTIPGLPNKANPQLMIYRNNDPASRDAVVEDMLAEGTTGYIVRALDGTPAVSSVVQVWPVTVKSAVAAGESDATTGAAQTTQVMFAVTDTPQLKVTVSA